MNTRTKKTWEWALAALFVVVNLAVALPLLAEGGLEEAAYLGVIGGIGPSAAGCHGHHGPMRRPGSCSRLRRQSGTWSADWPGLAYSPGWCSNFSATGTNQPASWPRRCWKACCLPFWLRSSSRERVRSSSRNCAGSCSRRWRTSWPSCSSLSPVYFFQESMSSLSRYTSQYPMLVQRAQQMAEYGAQMPGPPNVDEFVVKRTFGMMSFLLIFIVPILTMRTYSEEYKNGHHRAAVDLPGWLGIHPGREIPCDIRALRRDHTPVSGVCGGGISVHHRGSRS